MSKEMQYYEPDGFDTDQSMRDIKFEDVKSDQSDFSGSDDDSEYRSIMKQNKK